MDWLRIVGTREDLTRSYLIHCCRVCDMDVNVAQHRSLSVA